VVGKKEERIQPIIELGIFDWGVTKNSVVGWTVFDTSRKVKLISDLKSPK